ncbi:hypothetical protein ANO11243_043650 [Dothideomycetidae sp. 11243]|nr:hypothetical protein ANO11243_043650 [fungal sp. No.11243]
MSPNLTLLDSRAYHIICYGTFVGTTFFQSFIAGPVAFKALPRALFGRLQQAMTPVFFAIQTTLPILMALTYPGERLIGSGAAQLRAASGLTGVADNANRMHIALPLLAMFITSAVNLVVLGPATTRTMQQRHHQETRDGKKSYDSGPHSPEMAALNKKFGTLHGISSVFDLVGFVASLYYGWVLAARL